MVVLVGGSLAYGPYHAIIRTEDQRWLQIDKETVSIVQADKVCEMDALVAFYERKDLVKIFRIKAAAVKNKMAEAVESDNDDEERNEDEDDLSNEEDEK